MDINLEASAKVMSGQTDTYMAFRSAIPKPRVEDAHLRHILRFYIVRAMFKRGVVDVYVLPKLTIAGSPIQLDVAAWKAGIISCRFANQNR
jgi:hypothetical protein